MASHQVRKRKYSGDHEEGNTCTEEGKTNPNIYMFYESEKGKYSLHVSEFRSDTLSAHLVAKMQQDFVCRRGYAVYGSKLYAIGGEKTRGNGQPLDVNVFDLSSSQWEKGPSLRAGKPNPVVVVVKGKIYALAGRSRYYDPAVPAHSPSTILFEALDMTPSTGKGELRWINLPNPPFSHLYPKMGDEVVAFYTVLDNTIYFVLKNNWGCIGVLLYSFNVDESEWTDHTNRIRGRDLIADNIKNYYWVSMNSDIADEVMYMCYAPDTDSPGIKFVALNLKKNHIMPMEIEEPNAAYTKSAIEDGHILFWGVDFHRIGVNSLLPCLVIPLWPKPTSDPRFLLLLSHVLDKKFVVVCSYYTKHKIGCGKRVVYSCLLQLVGDEKDSGEGFQSPSDHAVILKQKYQTMSSQLNVLSAWSRA